MMFIGLTQCFYVLLTMLTDLTVPTVYMHSIYSYTQFVNSAFEIVFCWLFMIINGRKKTS